MRDSKRDTDVKNRLLDSLGEGKGGMIWEKSIEACILTYVKWIPSPGSMHEAGCTGMTLRDGMGREVGVSVSSLSPGMSPSQLKQCFLLSALLTEPEYLSWGT